MDIRRLCEVVSGKIFTAFGMSFTVLYPTRDWTAYKRELATELMRSNSYLTIVLMSNKTFVDFKITVSMVFLLNAHEHNKIK